MYKLEIVVLGFCLLNLLFADVQFDLCKLLCVLRVYLYFCFIVCMRATAEKNRYTCKSILPNRSYLNGAFENCLHIFFYCVIYWWMFQILHFKVLLTKQHQKILNDVRHFYHDYPQIEFEHFFKNSLYRLFSTVTFDKLIFRYKIDQNIIHMVRNGEMWG